MAEALFARLDRTGLERAKVLPLFANAERLAYRPRCGEAKNDSRIRPASHALAQAYIQPNSPIHFARLVFDLDWHQPGHRYGTIPIRYLATATAWQNDMGLPEPSWVALNKDKNSAHIGYELLTPVARHNAARLQPQRYLAAVEHALSEKLGADAGFSGALCKNPLHDSWDFFRGAMRPYDLHDLAEHVELKSIPFHQFNREVRGEVGRNVYLFDKVRFWAYDSINDLRKQGYERWCQIVMERTNELNSVGYSNVPALAGKLLLPLSECRAIAKSVASWTWKNHGRRELTDTFRKIQSVRGMQGAVQSAAVKRESRESQIRDAIQLLTSQRELATMTRVAELVGVSKQTLSKHYRDFFTGTTQ